MVANTIDPTTDIAIEITRTFDAPRELVWRAWTQPEHLLRWYCPTGFEVVSVEADVRPGGTWRSEMRSPDGERYIHAGVYIAVDAPERLVLTHSWERNDVEPEAMTRITVTLTEDNGRTHMRFEQVGFGTVDSGESHRGGWTGAFDNLEHSLAHPDAPGCNDTADRELVIVREFDAPRELVFAAYSDIEHISNWWGPVGFTTTTHAFDFKPGGAWRLTMHGPDGRDYENRIIYRVILPGRCIIYDHDPEVAAVCGRTILTFEPVGADRSRTKLTLRMVFASAEHRERVAREYGAMQGGIDCVTRLGQHLAATAGGSLRRTICVALPSEREVVIARSFDAPRQLVFDAWTKPEMASQWLWGPDDWPLTKCEVDAKPGGKLRYEWTNAAAGTVMGMSGEFRAVDPPCRTVHTEIFDEDWTDGEANVTTDLIEHDGLTQMMMTVVYSSHETREKVLQTGMLDGMTQTYQRLEALLASAD